MNTALKPILLILILVVFQERTYGQRFPSHIGIKGGLNFSNLSGNNQSPLNTNYDNRSGADFELFIETKISRVLTFQSAGLEFSPQGAKKKGFQAFRATEKYAQYFPAGQLPRYLYADIESEQRLNYLLLPTIFRIHTNADGKLFMKPYISAGFYVGYLFSAKEVRSGSSLVYRDDQHTQPLSNTVEVFSQKRSSKAELHKFNIGISSSVGFSIDIRKARVYIEGGGNYGLININKQIVDGKNYIKSLCGKIRFSYNVGQVLPLKF